MLPCPQACCTHFYTLRLRHADADTLTPAAAAQGARLLQHAPGGRAQPCGLPRLHLPASSGPPAGCRLLRPPGPVLSHSVRPSGAISPVTAMPLSSRNIMLCTVCSSLCLIQCHTWWVALAEAGSSSPTHGAASRRRACPSLHSHACPAVGMLLHGSLQPQAACPHSACCRQP